MPVFLFSCFHVRLADPRMVSDLLEEGADIQHAYAQGLTPPLGVHGPLGLWDVLGSVPWIR